MESSNQAATEYVTVERFDSAIEGIHQSIDQLADAVRVGFEEVDKRFDHVDTRLSSVEKKVENLEGHVQRIDSRLARQQEMIDDNRTGLRTLRVHVGLGAE